MKTYLQDLLKAHLRSLGLSSVEEPEIDIPKVKQHGDYATNVAMQLARLTKTPPRQLASRIQNSLEQEVKIFEKIEIAGPGFLNFFLNPMAYHTALKDISSDQGLKLHPFGQGKRVLIEFVSANPTGPLHIGHGRNAVVGDVMARVFEATGYEVTREFYVNDHGVQVQTLGTSVLHYYRLKMGQNNPEPLPEKAYRGKYLEDLVGQRLKDLKALEDNPYGMGKTLAQDILAMLLETLKRMSVTFDHLFLEGDLYQDGRIAEVISALKEKGKIYEVDGAVWFKSTDYGDDKDRVLVKQDGSYTYLTPDITYHKDKFERSYDLYVNVLGADHGGYLARLRASVDALGFDSSKLKFLLMQLVSVVLGSEVKKMSKRAGTLVTLNEVLDKVGVDVTRFFLIMRSHHTALDFDLELAQKQSSENPVYYIQYAHARMASILRKAQEEGIKRADFQSCSLDLLSLPEELELIKKILSFEEVLEMAVNGLEPHRISFYVMDLAKSFQAYYTKAKMDDRYRVITENRPQTLSKLFLIDVLLKVFKTNLNILGVAAPDQM